MGEACKVASGWLLLAKISGFSIGNEARSEICEIFGILFTFRDSGFIPNRFIPSSDILSC